MKKSPKKSTKKEIIQLINMFHGTEDEKQLQYIYSFTKGMLLSLINAKMEETKPTLN